MGVAIYQTFFFILEKVQRCHELNFTKEKKQNCQSDSELVRARGSLACLLARYFGDDGAEAPASSYRAGGGEADRHRQEHLASVGAHKRLVGGSTAVVHRRDMNGCKEIKHHHAHSP